MKYFPPLSHSRFQSIPDTCRESIYRTALCLMAGSMLLLFLYLCALLAKALF